MANNNGFTDDLEYLIELRSFLQQQYSKYNSRTKEMAVMNEFANAVAGLKPLSTKDKVNLECVNITLGAAKANVDFYSSELAAIELRITALKDFLEKQANSEN